MTIYQMRVTEDLDDSLVSVMLWLRTNATVLIIAKELGSQTEKKHIHALIELDESKKSGFIQAFHKNFKDKYKGNKGYSCEVIKKALNNNLRYLCKGESLGIYNVPYKGKFTDAEVELMNQEYWQQNQLTNFSKAVKKTATGSWCEKVSKEFEIAYPQIVINIQKYHSIKDNSSSAEKESYNTTRELLFDFCMKSLGKSYKVLDEQIIKKLYNGCMNSFIQSNDESSVKFNKKHFKQMDTQFGLL